MMDKIVKSAFGAVIITELWIYSYNSKNHSVAFACVQYFFSLLSFDNQKQTFCMHLGKLLFRNKQTKINISSTIQLDGCFSMLRVYVYVFILIYYF